MAVLKSVFTYIFKKITHHWTIFDEFGRAISIMVFIIEMELAIQI